MSLIELTRSVDDDSAFIFRIQHLIAGVVRYARPKYAHITKMNNWFGVRWLCFAGSKGGKEFHEELQLCAPPFAPNRVINEQTYRRHEQELKKIHSIHLHDKTITSADRIRPLDKIHASGIFCWFSSNTAKQDRGSIMVYEVNKNEPHRAWYAELQKKDGVWTYSSVKGTSLQELENLETSYGNQLEPLYQHTHDIKKRKERELWKQVLAKSYEEGAIAQATVLISQYRTVSPGNVYGRLIHARILSQNRLFEKAIEEFKACELLMNGPRNRHVWLKEWAEASELRGDLLAAESAYRELVAEAPDETPCWIMLGCCLAKQGKLAEAETILRPPKR